MQQETSWFKFGILCLQKKNIEKAIQCFQNDLRLNSGNPRTWQCLGEAYLARGSYENAFKAFTKSQEKDHGFSFYSTLKMADIRKILGDYRRASLEYEAVLKKEPACVAALVGLSESNYYMLTESLTKGLYEKSQALCIEVLRLCEKANLLRPDLCLPCNIAANACLYSALKGIQDDPGILGDNSEPLTKTRIIEAGMQWTKKAIALRNSYRLFHNLAIFLWLQYRETSNVRFLHSSILSLLLALNLNRKSSLVWNTLGVVSSYVMPVVAQHYLIRAIKCSKNAEIQWNNLGVLYLSEAKDDNLLFSAHRCFSSSQADNPYFINAWIGQSIIADEKQNKRALYLYEHCVSLGHHVESTLAFAQKVIQMNFVPYFPAALQSLALLVRKESENLVALTFLGCLLERYGLTDKAAEVFKKCLAVAKRKNSSYVCDCSLNVARTASEIDFSELTLGDDFNGLIVRGCYFWKRGNYVKAIENFEKCEALDLNPTDKKNLLLAHGTLLTLSGKAGKSLIFQGVNMSPVTPSMHLTVAAYLENDQQLFMILVREMHNIMTKIRCHSRLQTVNLLRIGIVSLLTQTAATVFELRLLNLIHCYPFFGKLHLLEALQLMIFDRKHAERALTHLNICRFLEVRNINVKTLAASYLVHFLRNVFDGTQPKKKCLKPLVKAYHLLPNTSQLRELIVSFSQEKAPLSNDDLYALLTLAVKLLVK